MCLKQVIDNIIQIIFPPLLSDDELHPVAQVRLDLICTFAVVCKLVSGVSGQGKTQR